MEAIVNVGMLKADKSAWLSNQDIRAAFVAEGVEVVSRTNYLTFKVGEEDTWIGRVMFDGLEQVYRVSERLSQDCIAVLTLPQGEGELVGPNASAWGVFNPAYFKGFEDGNI
jgi:hypothetical protein